MSYYWFIPIVLGIQFLLFEHKHMAWFRKLMTKTWFTNFLSQCVFCRCCWIGAGVDLIVYNERSILTLFCVGVSSGIGGLVFIVTFTPMLRVWERRH
jgi:hypothetical protein